MNSANAIGVILGICTVVSAAIALKEYLSSRRVVFGLKAIGQEAAVIYAWAESHGDDTARSLALGIMAQATSELRGLGCRDTLEKPEDWIGDIRAAGRIGELPSGPFGEGSHFSEANRADSARTPCGQDEAKSVLTPDRVSPQDRCKPHGWARPGKLIHTGRRSHAYPPHRSR